MLRDAVETFEIIESYPEDKYLPNFLLRAEAARTAFHAHIATDVEGENVRVVTMYVPNPREWDAGLRVRRVL